MEFEEWSNKNKEQQDFENWSNRQKERQDFEVWSNERKAAAQNDLSSVGKMYGLLPNVGQVDQKAKAAQSQAPSPETKAPQSPVQKPYTPAGQAARLGETNAPKTFTFSQSPKAEIPASRFSGEGATLPGWQAKTGMVPIPSSVDISSENLLAATPLGAYTNNWDNEAAGASAASVFADMDDETLSQLITEYSEQMRKLKSAGLQDSESNGEDYFNRSFNQVILGNLTDDVTLLGTAAQLGAGFFDLDLPMDIRDLAYDLANWEWSEEHLNQTAIDAVGLLPFIGSLKYLDEGAELAGSMDEIADLTRGAGKLDNAIDSTDELIEGIGETGKYIDDTMNTLTIGEKQVVDDLIGQGKTVERIPVNPKVEGGTPDFKVDGVTTELKILENANTNTGMKRVQDGFNQGAENVIIDARNSSLTKAQADEIIARAKGKYPNGQLPGTVEIWIDGQVITYP